MNAELWRRAADVFEGALERHEPDRKAYIAQACAGDDDLRREVEALLAEEGRECALDTPPGAEILSEQSTAKDFGPYRIESRLGAGGMGEVYRARDARLGRDVAIKVLPPAFADDPERLARFRREAHLLATLNHPNIGAIYGLESSRGVDALILELVEGPTLADRVAGGPMPLEDTIAIARQIADALAAAHEAGIVHRDLKPANVKVRDDGTVKVLDFGLAKITENVPARATALIESPTITTSAMTAASLILGTAAYMSPEQAKGKPADRRSDIWAFGCVLYEMLTGKRAFQGDDVSDTFAAILRAEPDWKAIGDLPPAIRRVIGRCLEKDPAKRYHSIVDVRLDLADAAVSAAIPAAPRRLTVERVMWALLVATLAGGVGYLARRPSESSSLPVRFQLAPPEGGFYGSVSGFGAGLSGATASPDGTRLAFIATNADGRGSLWIRPFDTGMARPLPDTDFALMPFWSPDGAAIAFFASGQLKIVELATGSVRVVAAATPGRGGTWGGGDVIVFSRGIPAQLVRVSAAGGEVTPIPTGMEHIQGAWPLWPHFLPDGRHFIYWTRVLPGGIGGGVMIASIEPGFTQRPLLRSDTAAAVLPAGFILFTRGDTVFRQTLDLERLEISGEPVRVNEPISVILGAGLADFSVSVSGVLVFQAGSSTMNQFAWFDRSGRQLEKVGAPGKYRAPALSPDEKRLAYEDTSTGDIWILDLERQTPSRFTSAAGVEACPVWFPNGKKLAYRTETTGVYEKDASGTSPERQLMNFFVNGPSQVTSDGKWLLYFWPPQGKQAQDIAALPLTGERTPRTLVESPFPDVEPYISPDMRWLAYTSGESGRYEVYVQPFPPTGERWQVSSAGGRQVMWRADGKELFFVADDRRFYAVDVNPSSASFDYGVPRMLFEMQANVFNVRNSYVPSADGQRFLVNTLDNAGAPLNVVLNWTPR